MYEIYISFRNTALWLFSLLKEYIKILQCEKQKNVFVLQIDITLYETTKY